LVIVRIVGARLNMWGAKSAPTNHESSRVRRWRHKTLLLAAASMVGEARAAVVVKGAATTARTPNGDDDVARSGWVVLGVLRRHCNNTFMVVLDGGSATCAGDLEVSSTLVVRERIAARFEWLSGGVAFWCALRVCGRRFHTG